MQSKDVILQVADETAEVMEEISDQLFDETDARFDQVIDQIKMLCSAATEYADKSDKQAQAYQAELLKKFEPIVETLAKLTADSNGQATEIKTKSDSIIAVLNELTQLLQGVSEDIASASDQCNSVSEQLKASVAASQVNNEKMLSAEVANAELIKTLSAQNMTTVEGLSGKIGEIMICLEAVSVSVKAVAEQQSVISQKQDELEKDVQYLKLPFYKRWFTKG